MYRTAIQLGVAIVAALASALPAAAQWSQDPRGDSGAGQAGSAPAQAQAQPRQFAEDFDRDPVRGWEYSCQYALLPAGNGRALATRGGGHAMWVAAGHVSDFSMKFRYGYEQGTADVFFRNTNVPNGHEFYCLMIGPHQTVLARRAHLPGNKYPEKRLAAAPVAISPKAWHDVIIQAKGGQIRVWIDGKGVLQAQDSSPLRSGLCGFGAIANSGHVLYDQVMLVDEGPSAVQASAASAAPASNWP